MVVKYRFEARRTAKVKRLNFVAFDCETESDGSFICGAFYGQITGRDGKSHEVSIYADTLKEFHEGYEEIERIAKRVQRSFCLIGFNTAYDLPYLGNLVDSSKRLDAGARFIMSKTITGRKIYDISNHVIGRLIDWIDRLNMQERYGICKREGYLDSIEGKKSQVLDDAKATYYLAVWVQDNLNNEFNIPFKATKFGAALEIYKRNYFKDSWLRQDDEQWKHDFERQGYYGGRVEVFRRGTVTVESYDVNSMYVAIMRDSQIPNPGRTKYLRDEEEIRRLIDEDKHLMVECRVRVPKLRIGLLPYRDTENKKLLFPYGEWSGVYHSLELKAAMQYGMEIVKIKRALYYPETKQYFREYARMTLRGRKAAKKAGDVATEQLYKYYGNGLYGKFGQRNGGGSLFVKLEQFTGDIAGLTTFEDARGEWWIIVPGDEAADAEHSFPIVSATITAYARIKILHALMANSEEAVYCDTDSMKCIGHPEGIDIGKEPGQWDYEYTDTQEFYAPKVYGDKRKGVPKSAVLQSREDNIEIWEFERPVTFKEGFRRHILQNVWEKKVKVLMLMDTKREWLLDGTSYPLYIFEPDNATISFESYNDANREASSIMSGSAMKGSC